VLSEIAIKPEKGNLILNASTHSALTKEPKQLSRAQTRSDVDPRIDLSSLRLSVTQSLLQAPIGSLSVQHWTLYLLRPFDDEFRACEKGFPEQLFPWHSFGFAHLTPDTRSPLHTGPTLKRWGSLWTTRQAPAIPDTPAPSGQRSAVGTGGSAVSALHCHSACRAGNTRCCRRGNRIKELP
jgi:hypothetical protein